MEISDLRSVPGDPLVMASGEPFHGKSPDSEPVWKTSGDLVDVIDPAGLRGQVEPVACGSWPGFRQLLSGGSGTTDSLDSGIVQ